MARAQPDTPAPTPERDAPAPSTPSPPVEAGTSGDTPAPPDPNAPTPVAPTPTPSSSQGHVDTLPAEAPAPGVQMTPSALRMRFVSGARKKGLEMGLSMGADGCSGQICKIVGPFFAGRMNFNWRFSYYASVGLHMAINAQKWKSGIDGFGIVSFFFGPDARLILPIKKAEVWTGLGVGLYATGFKSNGSKERLMGGAIAWGMGLRIYMKKAVRTIQSLGFDLWFYMPRYGQSACVYTDEAHCTVAKKFDGFTWLASLSYSWHKAF